MNNTNPSIDDYLRGALDAAQRQEFEAQLRIDPDLRDALAIAEERYQWHHQGLPEAAALMQQVIEERAAPPSPLLRHPLQWWLLSFGLLFALAFGLYRYAQRSSTMPVAPFEGPAPQFLPSDTSTTESPATSPRLQPPADSSPIAQRDAAPATLRNPYLDALVEERLRDFSPSIQLQGLPIDTLLLPTTDGTVFLKLNILTGFDALPELFIYPHFPSAFEGGHPVLQAFPTYWRTTSQGYEYRFAAHIPLAPGVYYLYLEAGAWPHVSRFRVGGAR